MPPSIYIAYLTTPLTLGGSETEVFVNTLQTLTGETISFSYLAPFTKGYIVVDPEAKFGEKPEIISFTDISATDSGFTGATRGLSSVTSGSLTANKVYHGTGTPVIISWGGQNIADLITYVNGLIAGSAGSASNSVSGVTKITKNLGSAPRAMAALVSAQSSPNLTLKVNAFSFVGSNSTNVVYAGGNTSTITAPSVNPRIDLIVYNTDTSTLLVRTGTEAASPSRPTPTTNDYVLAAIYNRVGETSIKENDDSTNGYILDWYESSRYNTSSNLTSIQVSAGVDQGQTTQNASFAIGEANATTKHSIAAQNFVPTVTAIKGFTLYKKADTGSFTGSVKFALQADTNGSPSGSDLVSYTVTNAVWLLQTSSATFTVKFSSEYTSVVPGSTYWIVITPSTSDNSNHPNFGVDNASAHSLSLKYNNSTDGWILVASQALYFQTISGTVSRILEGDSTGLVPLYARPYSFLGLSGSATPSFSIPGGLFGLTGGLKITIAATGGSSGTLVVAYNGSTLISASIGSGAYSGTVYVLNQSSLSSQIIAALIYGSVNSSFTNTSSIDTGEPGVLTLTLSGNTLNYTTVEKIG